MNDVVFVGDIGTEIALDCGAPLTGASLLRIVVKKPSGAIVNWTAVADGPNGLRYVTQAGDLDQAGDWQLQAFVQLPTWTGRGQIVRLTVLPALV